jgi:hypothetical protein
MKRLAVVVVVLAGLAAAQVASAHHTASGAQKRAVLQSIERHIPPLGPVTNGHNCEKLDVSCWQVIVSANAWASSRDTGPGNDGAGEFAFISHLEHGQWKYVGGWGEGTGLNCTKLGMPPGVARDLGIPDCP